MKLSQCSIGRIVITDGGEIGHVVGLTYSTMGIEKGKDSRDVIPVVMFPDGEGQRGIHHHFLSPYED